MDENFNPGPDDELVPDHLLPPHLKAQPFELGERVPDHLLPDHLKAQPEPLQATPDLSGPVTVPFPLDTAQIMEMIAGKLTGPVKDMYEADISRGVPHDDAMARILDTTAGASQARLAYKSILKEQQRNAERVSKGNAPQGNEGRQLQGHGNDDAYAGDAGQGQDEGG